MRFLPWLVGLFLGAVVFWGVDVFCGSKTAAAGVVVGHTYTPEMVTYTAGANNQLVPVVNPARYYLDVRGPHGLVTIEAEPYSYMTREGERISYTESVGLITGHLYSL